MTDTVIRVENLGKRYRIGGPQAQYKTIRETMMDLAAAPVRRLRRLGQPTPEEETIWALKDVSFEVKHGDVLGIIGRNGAGKTTLLKILSRITEPTEGYAEINGRVGSLLEVGTGFHPELTGRENIYLNGAILGMKRAEIDDRFDEIVAFSEIEKFLDTPVKRYSSGMYVRLAFSVAAHLEPEILLVDEVLAVGDAAFQKKCLGKMEGVAKEGRTVLFVSHNMGAIRGLCQRAVWIDEGRILEDAEAQEVVSDYLNGVTEGLLMARTRHDEQVVIERVVLRDSRGEKTLSFAPGDCLVVEINFRANHRLSKPYFWVGIGGQHGPLFGASMLYDDLRPEEIEGSGTIACIFESIPLLPQTYTVRVGARDKDGTTLLTETKEVAFFNVTGKMSDAGFTGELADVLSWDSASMVVPYKWRLPDGRLVGARIKRPGQEKGTADELGG